MIAVDASKSAVLVIFLDFTAAFDTVAQKVLIWHLEHLIGIRGTTL